MAQLVNHFFYFARFNTRESDNCVVACTSYSPVNWSDGGNGWSFLCIGQSNPATSMFLRIKKKTDKILAHVYSSNGRLKCQKFSPSPKKSEGYKISRKITTSHFHLRAHAWNKEEEKKILRLAILRKTSRSFNKLS